MRHFHFPGGTAVVTGAASAIGEELAYGLARRGADLVLLDRDAQRLDGVAAALRQRHPEVAVDTYLVDLADAAATRQVGEAVRRAHPRIRLLVNNAGVALGGRFDQVTLDEFEWVVDVNFRAPVVLSHVLLPALTAEPGSHLVTVSSVFGLIAPAGQTAYAASKFAVRGFTEALRHELVDCGVGVTSVHPGGVRTRIAESARPGSGVSAAEMEAGRRLFAKLSTIDPARAAEVILRGVRRRRPRVLIGWSARLPDLLVRALPGGYGRGVALASRPVDVPVATGRRAPDVAAPASPAPSPAAPSDVAGSAAVPGEPA